MSMPAFSNDVHQVAASSGSSHWALGDTSDVLPRIFEEGINIAVMWRELSPALTQSVLAQCRVERPWQLSWLGRPDEALSSELYRRLPAPREAAPLVADVRLLAEAIAYLFDSDMLGIRLRLLDAAMCPRFHVDNLPVRLVSTYQGPGSEWLPEAAVNRAGLGAPAPHKPQIVRDPGAVQRLEAGDLALLKGSGWVGSEHLGLVHRSPTLAAGQKRLLLTIDPA